MENSNKSSFIVRHLHLLILGGVFIVSLFGLILVEKFDLSKLKDFGPVAHIYFNGMKEGLIISTSILFVSFISFLFLKEHFNKIQSRLKSSYAPLSDLRKNILILAICLIFVFANHSGNIINGYFNMDDFEVVGINHSIPFSRAILMPHGNDHTIPLFRTEMKALNTLFGQNKIPYNALVFIVLSIIPFFTYLTLKRLDFPILSFIVFLVLFSGATSWADMLTGFYIVSIYLQIILFFAISSWAYTAWSQTKENRYMVFFTASIMLALASDTSGIWVIPAMLVFMVGIYKIRMINGQNEKLI